MGTRCGSRCTDPPAGRTEHACSGSRAPARRCRCGTVPAGCGSRSVTGSRPCSGVRASIGRLGLADTNKFDVQLIAKDISVFWRIISLICQGRRQPRADDRAAHVAHFTAAVYTGLVPLGTLVSRALGRGKYGPQNDMWLSDGRAIPALRY